MALTAVPLSVVVQRREGVALNTELPPVATSVTVAPPDLTLAPTETSQLVPTLLDQNGAAIGGATGWIYSSGTPAKATVSSTGLVTGVAAGTSTITITHGPSAKFTTVVVTVVTPQATVHHVNVTPTSLGLTAGAGTGTLTADPEDSSNNDITGRTVTWRTTSGGAVVVSLSGSVYTLTVTPNSAGSDGIIATCDGVDSATIPVTVVANVANPNLPTDVTMVQIVDIDVDTLTTDLALVDGSDYGTSSLTMHKQSGIVTVRDMSASQSGWNVGTAFPSPPTGNKALVWRFFNDPTDHVAHAGDRGKLTKTGIGGTKTAYFHDYFAVSAVFKNQADGTIKTTQGFVTGDTNDALCNLRGSGTGQLYISLTMQNTGNNTGHHPTTTGTTNITRNAFARREIVWVMESSVGAGDGSATLFLDGVKAVQVTGIDWSSTAGAGTALSQLDIFGYFGGTSDTTLTQDQYIARAGIEMFRSTSRAAIP